MTAQGLQTLIARARSVRMTEIEQEEQRRSFAYGTTKIENDLVSKEMVKAQAESQRSGQKRER
jgi:hypothetical protein